MIENYRIISFKGCRLKNPELMVYLLFSIRLKYVNTYSFHCSNHCSRFYYKTPGEIIIYFVLKYDLSVKTDLPPIKRRCKT